MKRFLANVLVVVLMLTVIAFSASADSNHEDTNFYNFRIEARDFGMELYLPATSAETNYPQVDLVFSDVHYSFDTSGRLVRLSNGSNQIVISYVVATDDRIQTITDSVGRKFHFTYVNGYLTSIDATTSENVAIASATVSYSVVGGKLTSVTYATDNVVSYAYDTSNRLSSVVNADLCGYTFSYTGNTDVVTTVTNKAAMGSENEASGYETIFDRSVEEKVTITRDTVQYQYSFDGCGRLAGCFNGCVGGAMLPLCRRQHEPSSVNPFTRNTTTALRAYPYHKRLLLYRERDIRLYLIISD